MIKNRSGKDTCFGAVINKFSGFVKMLVFVSFRTTVFRQNVYMPKKTICYTFSGNLHNLVFGG